MRRSFLDSNRGDLYLGATAPDIRLILDWERQKTHFFDLNRLEHQSSVSGFFEAQPKLRDAGSLDKRSAAFVAGYLTHLVLDERWIETVYRPFFGKESPLKGDLRARMMDRLLQYSLDRERRLDRAFIGHLLAELARSELDVQVDFLDSEVLTRWRELTLEIVNRAPSWEHFRNIVGRQLGEAGVDKPEWVEEFLRSLPEKAESTIRYLTPERIRSFVEDSVNRSVEVTKEYLDCA